MNQLLGDLVDVCALVYLDDIIIFSHTEEEHRKHVCMVFDRLAQFKYHVSSKKCELFSKKVEFLGHTVSAAGVGIVQAKVDAIKQWPQPIYIKDVQAFLGLVNYYRWFVKGFAQIALPLTNLTHKSQDFAWSEACEQSFRALKQRLIETPILQVYDDSLPIAVWVDASDFAIGATLVQQYPESKVWLPVEYLSHRLSEAESWYSATEREFVALVSAFHHWHHHLVGRQFTVCTDHASLQYLQTQPSLSHQQVHWLDLFSQFDMTICIMYLGSPMLSADALSYCPDLAVVVGSVESGLLTRIHEAQAAASGDSWEQLKKAGSACERGFIFCDGLLCHTHGGNEVSLVIPEDAGLQTDLLRQFHDDLVVGILVCITWLVPYPNNIGGKDCMLMLNNTVNSAWFARERRL